MTHQFAIARNNAPVGELAIVLPARPEMSGAFMMCPPALMPMQMYWGIYQEAYRRAAVQAAAAERSRNLAKRASHRFGYEIASAPAPIWP